MTKPTTSLLAHARVLKPIVLIASLCASSLAFSFECDSLDFQRALGKQTGLAVRLSEAAPDCMKIEAKTLLSDPDPSAAVDYLACYSKLVHTRAPEIPASMGLSPLLLISQPFNSGYSEGYGSPMLEAPQVASRVAQALFRSERSLLGAPAKAEDLKALKTAAAGLAQTLWPTRSGPSFLPTGASQSRICSSDFDALAAPWNADRKEALTQIHRALNPEAWAKALDSNDQSQALAMSSLAVEWAEKGGDPAKAAIAASTSGAQPASSSGPSLLSRVTSALGIHAAPKEAAPEPTPISTAPPPPVFQTR